MRISKTTPPVSTRRPHEEIAHLGKEIYARSVRPLVEADHHGEVVAIDVDSGTYALGKNAIDAAETLREQHPDAQVWLMGVGHGALYHFGGRSLRSVE